MLKYVLVALTLIALPGLSLASLTAHSQANNIIYVPQQYSSLQDAINAAAPGTTIYVAQGYLYNGSVLIQGKQDLTIIGQGGVVLNYGGQGNTTIFNSTSIIIENMNISAGLDITSSNQVGLRNVNVSGVIEGSGQPLGEDLLAYDVNTLYMQGVIAYWTMPGMTYTTYQGLNITDSSNITLNNVVSYALNGYAVYIDNSNDISMRNDLFNSPSNGGIAIGILNSTKATLSNVGSNSSQQLYVSNVSSLSINKMDYCPNYQPGAGTIIDVNQININEANFSSLTVSQFYRASLTNVLDLGALWISGQESPASAVLNGVSVYQFIDISNLSSSYLNNVKVYNVNFQTGSSYGLYLTNFQNSQITGSNIWGGMNISNGNYLNITSSLIPTNNVYEYYSVYILFNNISNVKLDDVTLGNASTQYSYGVSISNGSSLTLDNLKGIYLGGFSINSYGSVEFTGSNITIYAFSLSGFSNLVMVNSDLGSYQGMNVTGRAGSLTLLKGFKLEADNGNPYTNGIMVYNVYNFTAVNSTFSSHDGQGGIGVYTDGIPYVYLTNVKSVGWFGYYGGTGIWLVSPIEVTMENINVTGIDTQSSFSYPMLGQTGIMITNSSKVLLNDLSVSSFNNAIEVIGNENGITLSKVSTRSFNIGVYVESAYVLSLSDVNVYVSSESPSYGIYLNGVSQVNVNWVFLTGRSNQVKYTNFEASNGKSLTISHLSSSSSGTGPYVGLYVYNYSTLALTDSNIYDGIYLAGVPYTEVDNVSAGLSTNYGVGIYALSVLNGRFSNVDVLRNAQILSTGIELTGFSGRSTLSLNNINSQ
ncbi:MAG: hypothetical protein ACP5HK_04840, partial [Acidilobus sp.]